MQIGGVEVEWLSRYFGEVGKVVFVRLLRWRTRDLPVRSSAMGRAGVGCCGDSVVRRCERVIWVRCPWSYSACACMGLGLSAREGEAAVRSTVAKAAPHLRLGGR